MASVDERRWWYFLMVACGVLLSTLDSSMVNIALPSIMRDFQLDFATVERVVLVYLMIITFSLVFWGRLADRYGRGRIFLVGMVVFCVGSAFCTFATVFSHLVWARCFQAFGASMLMASGPAIIKLTTPQDQLGKTLGMVGLATSCGLMSGPVIGGYLISHFSWRAIFFVSVPFGAVCSMAGALYLLPALSQIESRKPIQFDWPGGIVWIFLVLFSVYFIHSPPGSQLDFFCLALVLIVLVIGFVKIEGVVPDPILPLVLVRQRYYWTAMTASFLSFSALFIVLILMPLYLDFVLHFSASRIGLVMMSVPVTLVFMSPLSGWLYDRLGSARLISTTGLGMSCLAIFLIMQLKADPPLSALISSLALLGSGQAVFLTPNSASVLKIVAEEYAGITAGILATARNFGMLVGAAIAGTLFSLRFSLPGKVTTLHGLSPQDVSVFLEAIQSTMLVAFVMLLIGMCISLLRD